ncbi:MAG: hypothetical protein JKX76_15105 [Colwellia sp.]|nr:hypothetical protein [Colwellia sp.]
MSRSLQLFIESSVDEIALINFLNSDLKLEAETLTFPKSTAKYFVQLQEYSQGFLCGINVSWKDSTLDVNEIEFASALATKFLTRIVFESESAPLAGKSEWLLIDSFNKQYSVNVVECDDGLVVYDK